MSAAIIATQTGRVVEEEEVDETVGFAGADLRSDLTTSLTPRLRALALFASAGGWDVSMRLLVLGWNLGEGGIGE